MILPFTVIGNNNRGLRSTKEGTKTVELIFGLTEFKLPFEYLDEIV